MTEPADTSSAAAPREPAGSDKPVIDAPQYAVRNLELKAAVLLVFFVLLLSASALYLLYARGAFEPTQELVLTADDSEGVVAGMDLTFSGFPIGRVRRTELAADGSVRIVVDIPQKDAHWLRQSSVFTLVRGLVGNTNIRAYTGVLTDPKLEDGAIRPVLRGDVSAEIPKVIASTRELLDNLNNLSSGTSALSKSMANVQVSTERLKGPRGVLSMVFGNDEDAAKVVATLERTNTLLARLDGVALRADNLTARADGMVAKADTQLLGKEGVVADIKTSLQQVNSLLTDTRASMQRVDAILKDGQAISSNAKEASSDLGALRADVESNLRKVESLINDINRKWPFAKDTEVKLP
jgi:phospholipid/cholesterol/gamma-HCH transport system substrate-binding protein